MKDKKNIVIVILSIVLILVVGFMIYKLVFDKNDSNENNEPNYSNLTQTEKEALVKKKEFNDSFTINVNNVDHKIDIKYTFYMDDSHDEGDTEKYYIYSKASLKYDNKIITDNILSVYRENGSNIDLTLKLKLSDLEEKFTSDNIRIVKGKDNKEYITFYSKVDSQIGLFSDLYVLNDSGEILTKIENTNSTTIDGFKYYGSALFKNAKVNSDHILFFAFEKSKNSNIENTVITEYKMTINNSKLSFELVKTYDNQIVSGGGSWYNDIVN